MPERGETIPIKEGLRFDEKRLAAELSAHVEGFKGGLTATQFRASQRNPTFLVQAGDMAFVLRRRLPTLSTAREAIEREWRVHNALFKAGIPVGRPRHLCLDENVIGGPFFVSDYVAGRIFRDPALPGFEPRARASIFEAMVKTLASLHALDPEALGLGDLAKPRPYYPRQIERAIKAYEQVKTEDLQSMTRLMEWFPKHVPADQPRRLIHSDFRIDKLVFHPTEPRILGIVDWEAATLGDPFADLAFNCVPYHVTIPGMGSLTLNDNKETGIPAESDYLALYARYANLASPVIPNWHFHLGFALFRLAALAQGIVKRGRDNPALAAQAKVYGAAVRAMATQAWMLVEGEST